MILKIHFKGASDLQAIGMGRGFLNILQFPVSRRGDVDRMVSQYTKEYTMFSSCFDTVDYNLFWAMPRAFSCRRPRINGAVLTLQERKGAQKWTVHCSYFLHCTHPLARSPETR
jgi:hypothetical protein